MKNFASFGIVALGAMLLAGCNKKPSGPEMVNVEGIVTVEGEPMENLRVEFWPKEAGQTSAGRTDANGHFVLELADASGVKGAVVGPHGVAIRDLNTFPKFMGRAGEDTDPGIDPRISIIYGNALTSGLTEQINGPRTDIKFDLKKFDPEEGARMRQDQPESDSAAAAPTGGDDR
mgnify:FL=1